MSCPTCTYTAIPKPSLLPSLHTFIINFFTHVSQVRALSIDEYTKIPQWSESDFFNFTHFLPDLPELEIIRCPVTFNPNLSEYEVNVQWTPAFSAADLSFLRHFQISVYQMMRGNPKPLNSSAPELELVNVGDISSGTGACSVI